MEHADQITVGDDRQGGMRKQPLAPAIADRIHPLHHTMAGEVQFGGIFNRQNHWGHLTSLAHPLAMDYEAAGAVNVPWWEYAGGKDHNVLPAEEAWGYDDPTDPGDGCRDCHSPDTHTLPVFDRLIMVDPWDVNGQPVYQPVREMTGLNPP